MLDQSTTEPFANQLTSFSPMIVHRIWTIMDVYRKTVTEISDASGIPLHQMFRLHAGQDEITVDQLLRICDAMDVHPMAALEGIAKKSQIIPPELMDCKTAGLAARLQRLPKVGRAFIEADIARAENA